MARMALTPDEVAIIEEVRKTKAIWNSAIDAAVAVTLRFSDDDRTVDAIREEIQELRK